MAPNSISGNRPKAPTRRAKGSGDWDSICITKAANGFEVRKCLDWKPGARVQPTQPKPYLATEPGEALAYLESCLGKAEHAAHEAGEAKGKY